MAQADFGTGKTLAVLAIVLGCFAILWPKIFYPMWQAAFALSSPKLDSDGRYRETDRPPHLHPGSINPRMRDGVTPENIHEKFLMREGRPFPNPQARQPTKSQQKSGGAMSIIMPIYTVGIIVFFIYTVLKLVFKKNPDEQKKPLIKDFHMDPEYRKFVCQETNESVPPIKSGKKKKKKTTFCSTVIKEDLNEGQAEELDAKDYEIYKLKKKLEETEQAMEQIIQHMGVVNASLNNQGLLEKVAPKRDSKLRKRRKGESSKKSDCDKKWYEVENEDDSKKQATSGETSKDLEGDLAELLSMCTMTEASIKSFNSPDTIEEDATESEGIETSEEESEENDSLIGDMIKNEKKIFST